MNGWKSKLFGDNTLNFWGWLVAGVTILVASAAAVLYAVTIGAYRSPEAILLFAIWVLLVGVFGVLLQSYLARVARKLDTEAAPEDAD
ncbi:MAG: hypothetical protein AAGD14_06330 [Planctomycetota bacterium]